MRGRQYAAVRMNTAAIESTEFLHRVRPALERHDAEALAATVNTHWTPPQLCRLMRDGTHDARKVVCLTLGLVGDIDCTSCLVKALRDEDSQINELAEHALWSIWFRSGSGRAMSSFTKAVTALNDSKYDVALDGFHEAVAIDPGFAEAFNQCAIAHYMLEQWKHALDDCQAAVNIVPDHFGAWAGMGHCHVHLDQLDDAVSCYRQALEINPQMPGVAQALAGLQRN